MSSPVLAASAAVPEAVTGAGVSSVPSTSCSHSAAFNASSNPAAVSAVSRRARQDETYPVDTSTPSSADIMSAARSMPITSWDASHVAAAPTLRAIAGRAATHPGRQVRGRDMTASAGPLHHQVLGHRQRQGRQVEHLHARSDLPVRRGQGLATGRARARLDLLDPVRAGHPRSGRFPDARAARPASACPCRACPACPSRPTMRRPPTLRTPCPPWPLPSTRARPGSAAQTSSRNPGPQPAAARPAPPAAPRSASTARSTARAAPRPALPTPHTRAAQATRTRPAVKRRSNPHRQHRHAAGHAGA